MEAIALQKGLSPMKIRIALVLLFLSLACVVFTAQTDDKRIERFKEVWQNHEEREKNINALCAGEWETDYEMQKYCREQQNEGFVDLVDIWPEATEHIGEAVARCILDWSDGLMFDWRMIHYCTDKQLTAWKELQ